MNEILKMTDKVSKQKDKELQREKQKSVLKSLRLDAGFARAVDFADVAGVKAPTYFAHENGGRTIKEKDLAIYAKLLDLDPISLRMRLESERRDGEISKLSAISTALSTVSRETGIAVSPDFQFFVFDQLKDKEFGQIDVYIARVQALLSIWLQNTEKLKKVVSQRCRFDFQSHARCEKNQLLTQ